MEFFFKIDEDIAKCLSKLDKNRSEKNNCVTDIENEIEIESNVEVHLNT